MDQTIAPTAVPNGFAPPAGYHLVPQDVAQLLPHGVQVTMSVSPATIVLSTLAYLSAAAITYGVQLWALKKGS